MNGATSSVVVPASRRTSDGRLSSPDRCDKPVWPRLVSLAFMHVGCLSVIWVSGSWMALGLAGLLYAIRTFGLTAFYHRYYSHRAFKTSRWLPFAGGVLGCLALQKGPLWWAALHREHHRTSDRPGDVHSPHVHGILWAHMGWFLTPRNNELQTHLVREWMKFPELRWLDRSAPLVAIVFAALLYGLGALLRRTAPSLATNGPQLVVWCYFILTVALYDATYSVNSLAHLFGSRRFESVDDSRNNAFVAMITLGEGWRNNHHYYPSSARQGFYWWEVDLTYYALLSLEQLGCV